MLTASSQRARDQPGSSRKRARDNRNGATVRTPIASPVHHTVQALTRLSELIAPETTSVPAPIVALMSMLARAPRKTIANASCRRSSCRRKPTLARSMAATKGASVLPAAVTAAASGPSLIGRFTAKAATAIPGHNDRPNSRNAATAIPVGGHSGVTFCSTSDRVRPIRAPT